MIVKCGYDAINFVKWANLTYIDQLEYILSFDVKWERERICWLAYHTSLLRKLIECFSLLWKLFMQIYILSYSIHKSAEAWMNICKKRSVWFSQGKYKFLLTTHYSMPSSMRCDVMMCNGIVFVNFVNQCLLNTSNFLHHVMSLPWHPS